MMDYRSAMIEALKLAELGTGYVSPNPRVGAVILDENGNIIGKGWHKKFGGPHAEVEAVADAGLDTYENCTMVVTLEPCSHHGKTPPCAELLVRSGFRSVIIGTLDSNPAVAGKGAEYLRNAGIEVVVGIEEAACRRVNRAFFHHIQYGTPYVILKIAQSVDGNIATSFGESKWITSPESRLIVQKLRAECDSIFVGKGTLMADNPSLNVRDLDLPNPARIVADKDLTLPPDLNVYDKDNPDSTITFYHSGDAAELNSKGFPAERVHLDGEGHPDLNEILNILGRKYKFTSILVEGGAEIYSAFLAKNLADEIHYFISPKIIGKGKQVFNNFLIDKLGDAKELEFRNIEQIGPDIYLQALVRK